MILLWNLHVQEPIHAIHISLSCVNFFWKEVDRYYIWPHHRPLRRVEHDCEKQSCYELSC